MSNKLIKDKDRKMKIETVGSIGFDAIAEIFANADPENILCSDNLEFPEDWEDDTED